MPTVHNPTDTHLYSPRIHRLIHARETVEITEAEADLLEGNPILRVQRQPHPERETVKRGGRRAEVTRAPARETR